MGELLVIVLIALIVGWFYEVIGNASLAYDALEDEVKELKQEKLDWIEFNEVIPDVVYLDLTEKNRVFADDVEQGKIYIDFGKRVIWQAGVNENGTIVFKSIGKMYK